MHLLRAKYWTITFSGWPTQKSTLGEKYTWKLKQPGLGRFGGCWIWKLGIDWGRREFIVNLILSSIRIKWGLQYDQYGLGEEDYKRDM